MSSRASEPSVTDQKGNEDQVDSGLSLLDCTEGEICTSNFKTQRKSKDIEALRRKRKRYKDKKKALAKLQQCKNVNIDSTKFQLIDASGSTQDEGCSTADMWNLFTRKSCKDVAICDVFEAYDKKEQQINKEAKRMRLEDLHKEKQKYDLYGEYNDHEPCFPPSDNKHVEIELHTNLCAMNGQDCIKI